MIYLQAFWILFLIFLWHFYLNPLKTKVYSLDREIGEVKADIKHFETRFIHLEKNVETRIVSLDKKLETSIAHLDRNIEIIMKKIAQ